MRVTVFRGAAILLLGVCLCLAAPGDRGGQQNSEEAPPSDHFFSGMVTDYTPVTLTVRRAVLGKDPVRRAFVIAPDTTIEGELRVRARVTVRFITCDEGDRALHIIVRPPRKRQE